jgi:hypothetical protein
LHHEQAVVADARDRPALGGAAVDGDELAELVAVADLEPHDLAGEFQVLRVVAQAGVRVDPVASADPGRTLDVGVRRDLGALADLEPGADGDVWADHHAVGKRRRDRPLRWDGLFACVDQVARPSPTTTSPRQRAAVDERLAAGAHEGLAQAQHLDFGRTWSPGAIGRRKRALDGGEVQQPPLLRRQLVEQRDAARLRHRLDDQHRATGCPEMADEELLVDRHVLERTMRASSISSTRSTKRSGYDAAAPT